MVIGKSATKNIHLKVFENLLSIWGSMYLGVEFLGQRVALCLSFWRTTKLLSTEAELFYNPISMYESSNLSNTGYLHFGNYSHSSVYEVVSHCDFDLYFPID